MPVLTHHLPLCAAAAAAAAGWRYHKALRSCSGEGLAFICRWVELHEFERREEKGSVHVCERKESKEGGGERNRKIRSGSCMFAALLARQKKKGSCDDRSQGGRSSFDLELSVHSLHAERFKGRVSLWFWQRSTSSSEREERFS